MESDSISTGLEWENLALYRPMQLAFSTPFHGNIEFTASSSSSISVQSTPTKRSRASYHNMQNPCCQVEGCNLDLKMAKDYHRRHRICETHSKSPRVVVAGMERRFCQQCSRFHELSEFDDKKRSCRRRLSDHNARRRRVQPESAHLSSAGVSPSPYDQRQHNVLLDGLPLSLSNPHSSMSRHALVRPPNGPNMHSILDPRLQVASTNCLAPELVNADSLLSSNVWSFSDGESASTVHGNYAPVIGESESEPHHPTMFRNEGTSHHHQEYQLFKDPYDSDTFYPTQRSL